METPNSQHLLFATYGNEQAKLLETRITAERQARDREFRRELWLRQLDVLTKVADSVSRIAVAVTDDELMTCDAAVRDYEQPYWGNITFVDDPALSARWMSCAMISVTSVKDSSLLMALPGAIRSSRESRASQSPADVPSARAARHTS